MTGPWDPKRPGKKVWTFIIRGKGQIGIQLPGSPVLQHPGSGMTMWKMIGTEAQSGFVKAFLKSQGCQVETYTEEQSKEQEAERHRRLFSDDWKDRLKACSIVGGPGGSPSDEGHKLAEAILTNNIKLEGLIIDLHGVRPSVLISPFFHSFMVHMVDNGLLPEAKAIRWLAEHDFQEDNIKRWIQAYDGEEPDAAV